MQKDFGPLQVTQHIPQRGSRKVRGCACGLTQSHQVIFSSNTKQCWTKKHVCINMCIYTCVCIYIYIHTYIYNYIYTYIYTYVYIYIIIYVCMYVCIYIYSNYIKLYQVHVCWLQWFSDRLRQVAFSKNIPRIDGEVESKNPIWGQKSACFNRIFFPFDQALDIWISGSVAWNFLREKTSSHTSFEVKEKGFHGFWPIPISEGLKKPTKIPWFLIMFPYNFIGHNGTYARFLDTVW